MQNLAIIAQLDKTSFGLSSLWYLLGTDEVTEPHELMQALQQRVSPDKQANIMTALEKVQARGEQKGIEKGKREGIREGKREGILETAKNMLQFGISRENIAKMTGLATGDLRLL